MINSHRFLFSNGQVCDAYALLKEWFDARPLLLMCLDSNRDLNWLAKEQTQRQLIGKPMHNRIWFGDGQTGHVMAASGLLVGFDALFVFPPGAAPPERIPAFDDTTEDEFWRFPERRSLLLSEMTQSGSCGYFADGCGLICVLNQEDVILDLHRQLGARVV